ncbi:ABC transporter permease subunit [Modestobacter sp. I12A-02628]|uniref:Carbohydrate ABC transporter permease n=1 Tax=Goekera deserti TaxID=2497753 RepID=A0A7K3WGB4_9ACTN|nr:carbohydrate ABC transporter permease [Goekera deserti]MPQ98025.1 ABC transporter permease subunit [Goekera deserti]NDI48672.1 ABC transporter permease subunit [Goekera deserti]NEL54949.1 carbohydrate ABC transporter permease [Goekera deserti]
MATITLSRATPTPPAPTPRRRGRRRPQAGRAGPVTYTLLVLSALVSAFPLYWTVVAGSHTNAEIAATPPPFLPNASLFENIGAAMEQAPIGLAILNSVIVAGCITIGTVLFCTLAGFAFAKLRFRGQGLLLALVIGTMMVPTQLAVIPLFMMIADLQWVNQLQAVVLPTLVSAFGVFFMRQYLMSSLPDELLEAGRMDGASTFRIFRSIVLPVARPAMAVLAMLTFLTAWNDFFWPIIALTTSNPTVQVALAGLGSGYVPQRSVIMAGTLLGTLPVLIVFAVLGKQIVGGIMQGAVKG